MAKITKQRIRWAGYQGIRISAGRISGYQDIRLVIWSRYVDPDILAF